MSYWSNSRSPDLMLMILRAFLVADEGKTADPHRITFDEGSHSFLVEVPPSTIMEPLDGGTLVIKPKPGFTPRYPFDSGHEIRPHRIVPKPSDGMSIEASVATSDGEEGEASAVITLHQEGEGTISTVRTGWDDVDFEAKLDQVLAWFWPDHSEALRLVNLKAAGLADQDD